MTGYEGMITTGLDKALLSLALVRLLSVRESRDLPVISSLGVFTSSTWYLGARMATAAKTMGLGGDCE